MSLKRTGGTVVMLLLCLMLTGGAATAPLAAETGAKPVRVALLPFNMHAPKDMMYLQDGIREMLASRLGKPGKVQIVDKNAVTQALGGAKSEISRETAVQAGKTLKADYVLFGSLTALGQAVSIDAGILSVASPSADPVSVSTQTKSMDEVVPQINRFAQEINQKLFGAPVAQGEAASEVDAGLRNPELLLSGLVTNSDRISYINPNFIEVTPESALRQPGLWRSQDLTGAIVGMDTGDVDGDGKTEIAVITRNKLMVYRKEYEGLKLIGAYEGQAVDHFLWVSVADPGREGKALIFVTNLRKNNSVGAGNLESIQGDAGFTETLASMVFSSEGGKLRQVGKSVPYFLNAVDFPGRGKILIGQEKGDLSDGPFRGVITEMQMRGGNLATSVPVTLPDQCNVFNFAKADINGDHAEEIILIDHRNRLLVLNAAGDQIWKGNALFGPTTNSFEGKVEDRRFNMVNRYAIPSPIIVTDLNKDGIPEIVVNRSTVNFEKFLPEAMKQFDKSEIVSLSWDSTGMVENWKTREISGMVTALRVADINNAGKSPQLVAGLVQAKDFLKLLDAKSSIFSYELNVAAQPKKKTDDKK